MSENTPTTEEIREYVEVGGEPRPWAETTPEEDAWAVLRGAAFDRWLAEHDAKVLEDAATAFNDRLPDGTGNGRAYNSYTVARMLRRRAASLRVQAAGHEGDENNG